MEKRGISPLIATVLLLGFTVALAAVIMTWGMDFVETMQKSTEETANVKVMCATEVDFDIIGVCETATDGTYDVAIANNGAIDITKFTVRYYETEADVIPKPFAAVGAFGIVSNPIITGQPAVTLVEAIAFITVDGEDLACSDNVDSYGRLGEVIAAC